MGEILEQKVVEDTLKSLLDDKTNDKEEVLNLDDKKEEVEDKEDKEEEKEEEKKEEEPEEELDLEEPPDDEVEVLVPPKRKEILAAYPDLFKKFPYMEKALYREQQFTEYFPTPKDAKQALDTVDTFKKIEGELFNGDISGVLSAVNKEDPEAFKNIVDNLLINIDKVDKGAANHIFGNIIKHTVSGMATWAKGMSEEDSEKINGAARILYQYYFGNSEWKDPTNLGKGRKDTTVDDERARFNQERFDSTYTELERKTSNVLRATITSAIDPKGQMTDYVKERAIQDSLEELNDVLISDKRFKGILDTLWDRAGKKNYDADSVNAIRKAYLSRAKSELLPLIKKHRDAALKGLGKRVVKKQDEEVEERPNRQARRDDAPARKHKSTFDLLNED